MKKIILIFNGYYTPSKNYGGPTTSVENIVSNCSDHFDFRIIAANHDIGEKTIFDGIQEGWNQVGNAKVLYIDENKYNYNTQKISAIIKKTQASIVCLAGIFRPEIKWCAIKVCRKMNIPVLISPRGEVCKSTFAMKKYKKAPYAKIVSIIGLFRNVMFHATSEEEKAGLIRYFKIPEGNIYLVPNIAKEYTQREKHIKISGEIRIVLISRIQYKKNITYAIDIVNNLKCKTIFDIYGPMESSEYWRQCEILIALSPSNVKINYCGALNPEEVGEKFSEYDCFLFPTYSENYGHVIAEAMLNACPVVLSKGTTPWDDLNETTGFVHYLSDKDAFIKNLEKIALMNNKEYELLLASNKEYITKKIGNDDAIHGHIDMYSTIIKRFL